MLNRISLWRRRYASSVCVEGDRVRCCRPLCFDRCITRAAGEGWSARRRWKCSGSCCLFPAAERISRLLRGGHCYRWAVNHCDFGWRLNRLRGSCLSCLVIPSRYRRTRCRIVRIDRYLVRLYLKLCIVGKSVCTDLRCCHCRACAYRCSWEIVSIWCVPADKFISGISRCGYCCCGIVIDLDRRACTLRRRTYLNLTASVCHKLRWAENVAVCLCGYGILIYVPLSSYIINLTLAAAIGIHLVYICLGYICTGSPNCSVICKSSCRCCFPACECISVQPRSCRAYLWRRVICQRLVSGHIRYIRICRRPCRLSCIVAQGEAVQSPLCIDRCVLWGSSCCRSNLGSSCFSCIPAVKSTSRICRSREIAAVSRIERKIFSKEIALILNSVGRRTYLFNSRLNNYIIVGCGSIAFTVPNSQAVISDLRSNAFGYRYNGRLRTACVNLKPVFKDIPVFIKEFQNEAAFSRAWRIDIINAEFIIWVALCVRYGKRNGCDPEICACRTVYFDLIISDSRCGNRTLRYRSWEIRWEPVLAQAVMIFVKSSQIWIKSPLRPKLGIAWRHFCVFGIGCTRTVLSCVPACEGITCSADIGKWTYGLTRKLNLIYRIGCWNIICFAGRACNILNINITECCRCICRSYTKTDSQVFCVWRHNEILLIGVICFTCRLRLKCACLVCRQRNCRSSAICRRSSGYRSWYSVVIKGKRHEVNWAGSRTHSNIHTNSVCMSGCYRYFISTCTVIRSGGSIFACCFIVQINKVWAFIYFNIAWTEACIIWPCIKYKFIVKHQLGSNSPLCIKSDVVVADGWGWSVFCSRAVACRVLVVVPAVKSIARSGYTCQSVDLRTRNKAEVSMRRSFCNVIIKSARSRNILKIDIGICQWYSWRNIWRTAVDTQSQGRISVALLNGKGCGMSSRNIRLNRCAHIYFTCSCTCRSDVIIACGRCVLEHKHRNVRRCGSCSFNRVSQTVCMSRNERCRIVNSRTEIGCTALLTKKSNFTCCSVWSNGIAILCKIERCRTTICALCIWKDLACPAVKVKLIIKENIGVYKVIERVIIILALCISESKSFILRLGNRVGAVNHIIIIGWGQSISVSRCSAFYITDIFIALILLGRKFNLIIRQKCLWNLGCLIGNRFCNWYYRKCAVAVCNKTDIGLFSGHFRCVSRWGAACWVHELVNSVLKSLSKTVACYIALRENAVANLWIKIGCSAVNLYQSLLCGSKLCFIS